MSGNAMSLKARIRNLSKEKNVSAQVILQNYMFERFLERLSKSDFKNNFILKGGMLIASIVGIDSRSTMDMDTTIKGFKLNKDNILAIFNDIIKIQGTQNSFCSATIFQFSNHFPDTIHLFLSPIFLTCFH